MDIETSTKSGELTQMDDDSKYFEGTISIADEQKACHGDGVEVVVSGFTEITTSPRNYQQLPSSKPMDESLQSQCKQSRWPACFSCSQSA